MRKFAPFVLMSLLIGNMGHASAKKPDRPLGDSRVIATVPQPPGFPEGIAVNKNRFYVSGPASEIPGPGNSRILEYDLDHGWLLRSIVIHQPNQIPGAPFGLSQIAFDRDDRLYVVDTQQGIVRLNLDTEAQEVYSPPLPFLPPCSSAPAPCAPKPAPLPPLPNDIVFDKAGNLYVTDSFQATIWRIPAGGGSAQIWFQDPRLASPSLDLPFGVNGMRFDKKGETAYIAVTFGAGMQGYIYTLPLVNHPSSGDLKLFHVFEPFAGPDGVAFGKSGKLYVALAGTSQIAVLNPNGTQAARYSGPAARCNSTPLAWANPANMAFNDDEGTLLATNHASLPPNPAAFAVFDVFVDDKAQKLELPKIK